MTFADIIKKNCDLSSVKWWPKYAFHYTDISNAISIIQQETLYSRLYAEEEHLMKNDNASYQVIDMTATNAQSFVRFYFRPLTPTQYYNEGYKHPDLRYDSDINANVPVPVFFAFNLEQMLRDPKVKFSETSQAGSGSTMLSGEKSFKKLPFDKIYSDGYAEDDVLKFRHAELLYPTSYRITESLEAILCRNEFEQSMLLSMLRKENAKLFYKYKPLIKVCKDKMFEKNGLFIQDIRLDNGKISFSFANTYQKRHYTDKMMQKNGIDSLDPVKTIFSLEWRNSKQILKKASVEYALNYQKTNGIMFTLPFIDRATALSVEVSCSGDIIGYKEFVLTDIF